MFSLKFTKRKLLMVGLAFMLAATMVVSGIAITDKPSLDSSLQVGIGEKVITIGSVVYAAGTADYTCDGVADDVQFQDAVDALPAAGGKISVLTGNYVFSATVTRAIANVTIEGVGLSSNFTYDGVNPIFTAGGNRWVFANLVTDAGGVNLGATTGWQMQNVLLGATYYAYRSQTGQAVFNDVTVASLTDSGLTSGRVPIVGIGGLFGDSANLTWNAPSLNVGGANVTREATYVVAASDAPAHRKAQADWVCDGTADQVEIEAALNALSASGGIVQLTEGSYSISNGVDMVNNAMLTGSGMLSTVLTLTALTDENVITAISVNNTVIANMTVDGNRANNIDHGGATDAVQNGVYFRDVNNGKVISVRAKSAIYHGVFFFYSLNCQLLESILTDNGYRGIHAHCGDLFTDILDKGHHIVASNYFSNNLVADVYMIWERGDIIVNNVFHSSLCANAPLQLDAEWNSGNYRGRDTIVDGNYILYDGTASLGAVYMVYPQYITFTNNIVVSTQAGEPAIYAALGPSTRPAIQLIIANNIISSAGAGISAPTGDNYNTQCSVSYNTINATGMGIEWRGVTSYLKMDGNSVYSSSDVGVYAVLGSASRDTNSSFSGNTIWVLSDSKRAAYIADISYSKVDGNNIIVPNTGDTVAIHLDNFDSSTFTNNLVRGGDTTFLVYVGPTANSFPEISDNYLKGYAGIWLDNCGTVSVKGNYFQTGTDFQIDSDCSSILVESNYAHTSLTLINSCTTVTFRGNKGYIASGELSFASGTLTAGVANAICFAWHNPEYQDISIKRVVVEITTAGGTAGSHLDVGIADNATGLNLGLEFFNDLGLNVVQVNDSWVVGDNGTQTKWVVCQDSANATDGWVVGQILDANAASLVGRWYIEYVGR